MKKIIIASGMICLAGLFLNCSYVTVLRTQELYAVRDSLYAEIDTLKNKLVEEQQTQNELLRTIRADQMMRFSELEKQIGDIDSRYSENRLLLSKIDEKTGVFQRQLEAKLASDSSSLNSRNIEIAKLFQLAMSDFNAGRFDIAKKGFRDISSRFPESAQGEVSEYWTGECLYAKKEYSEAENVLLLYIKNFPHGTKACVALYKLGLCYDKMDKEKSRELVWEKLLDKCPDTQEAQIVKFRKQ